MSGVILGKNIEELAVNFSLGPGNLEKFGLGPGNLEKFGPGLGNLEKFGPGPDPQEISTAHKSKTTATTSVLIHEENSHSDTSDTT
ncbi:unnamed protein product [Adineta steineri]|uniref:Uncharacterized protein n=1 Tax=Adineta steineri TaxID=433720 RepID=A0A815KX54_9BILA|nr:unnamed protein product [Adineta steineri]